MSGIYGQQALPTAAPPGAMGAQAQLFPPLQPQHNRTQSALSNNMLTTPTHSRGPSLLQPGSPSRNSFQLEAAPPGSRMISAASSPLKVAVLPSTRDRVVAFYRKYNPSKLANIEDILKSYAGREVELMQALAAKYGPEEKWWLNSAARPPPQSGGALPQQQQVPPVQAQSSPMRSAGGMQGATGMMQQVRPGTPTLVATAQQQGLSQQQANFQQRLFSILKRSDPAKLHLIPQMLATFRGNEENLIVGLERKYALLQSQHWCSAPTAVGQFPGPQGSLNAPAAAVATTARADAAPGQGSVPSREEETARRHAHHHPPLRPLNPKLAELVISDSEGDSDEDGGISTSADQNRASNMVPPKEAPPRTASPKVSTDKNKPAQANGGGGAVKPTTDGTIPTEVPKRGDKNTHMGTHISLGNTGAPVQQHTSNAGDSPARSSRPSTPQQRQHGVDTGSVIKASTERVAASAASSTAAADKDVVAAAPRTADASPLQQDAVRDGDDVAQRSDVAPPRRDASQVPVNQRGSTPRASPSKRGGGGERSSAASTPSRRRTQTPTYAMHGDVVQPLTDRRSSETAIVVTPVMMLGGSRRSAVSDDAHDSVGRSGVPPANASSATIQRSPTRHLLNESSFNVPPRSASNSLMDKSAGASKLGTTLVVEDRRNVSVSPLSRSPSATRSLDVDHLVVPLSNNVGCDVPLRELHKSTAHRTTLTEVKGKYAHHRHRAEQHDDPNRLFTKRDGSPSATKEIDEGEKPLWVNPGAKGKLSRVYERGRENSSRDEHNERLVETLVRTVYRAPSPSPVSQKKSTATAQRPASAPRRASPSTQVLSHDRHKRPPTAVGSGNVSTTSQDERAATPSRLASRSVQSTHASSMQRRAASERQTAASTSTKSEPQEAPKKTTPKKQTPDYHHMLYHEIGPQGSVVSDMDVIVVDFRKEFKPNITNPPEFGSVLGVKKATPHHSSSPVPSTDGSHTKVSRSHTPVGHHTADVPERHATTISPHRKVIPVEHVPTMPSFDMYSSFRDSQKGRESAWAKAPIKVGLFDVSPPRRRRIVTDAAKGGSDARTASPGGAGGRLVGHEANNVRYDLYGHRLKIIRDAPHDPEAIEAQKKLVHRLSIPKPVYVRAEEIEHHLPIASS